MLVGSSRYGSQFDSDAPRRQPCGRGSFGGSSKCGTIAYGRLLGVRVGMWVRRRCPRSGAGHQHAGSGGGICGAQRELALQNLALRQQLAILKRKTKRPKLTNADRALWVALCRLWPDWQNALIII